jgi:hypothetical protein
MSRSQRDHIVSSRILTRGSVAGRRQPLCLNELRRALLDQFGVPFSPAGEGAARRRREADEGGTEPLIRLRYCSASPCSHAEWTR